MSTGVKAFLYLAIGTAIFLLAATLIQTWILPRDIHGARWVATVIALGAVGAIYTIRRSRPESD